MSSFEKGYQESLEAAKNHYENFPVVSMLLPARLKKHVAVIYCFSRRADDIADEGNIDNNVRIRLLDEYKSNLELCLDGKGRDEFWQALKNTIDEFEINPQYLYDLLSAFRQDIEKKRYENFDELSDYCRRSANPVGRIILQLSGIKNPECCQYSDMVCTALQLINMYQDICIDYEKERIYIPADEMKKFGVDEEMIKTGSVTENYRSLMKFQLQRNLKLFNEGAYLIEILPYRLKYQIAWTIYGGKQILYKIIKQDYDVFKKRPKLSKIDYVLLMMKGLMG